MVDLLLIENDNNLDKELKKERIANELRKIKYNFSYIGTKFLVETIYIIKVNNFKDYDLKNDIYPIVAKKFSRSVFSIKSDIRNATEKMYYDCEEDILSEYMNSILVPTPRRVINAVLKKL